MYYLCQSEETVLHVLRSCVIAKRTWESIGISPHHRDFFESPLLEWHKNLFDLSPLFQGVGWPLLFATTYRERGLIGIKLFLKALV